MHRVIAIVFAAAFLAPSPGPAPKTPQRERWSPSERTGNPA